MTSSGALNPATPLLVGREREQDMLRTHLAVALQGRGSVVLIGGEAGIGKTALAETFCQYAEQQQARVLVGRCYDLTKTPPYGLWVDLFSRYDPCEDKPPLPDAFAKQGTVGAVTSQAALFQQVLDFLKATLAAHHPLVVLLDDLHWADPASLDLLRFLARSLATLPVLLMATYRVDELTRRHPLYALLPILVREARAERLDLRPLNADELRALVAMRYRLGPAESGRLITYLAERAEGNPFFLGELLRTLEEEGILQAGANTAWTLGDLRRVRVPALLRQVIDARLARLDDETQRVLAVAAVIGQEVPLSLCALAANVDEEIVLAAVDRAVEAYLLIETPDGMNARFAHALTREAVYEGISPARRRRLHRQIAELLAAQPQPDPDAVAMHFQRAADSRAVEWLVRAGERAQLSYAWLTAIERYEAALALLEGNEDDLTQQGWLRYRIARLRRYSTPGQGIEYLDEALRIAAVVSDRALAAAARYSRGLCLFYESDYDAAIRDMSAGCDALEALPLDEQARLDLAPDDHGVPTVTNPRGMLIGALTLTGRLAEAFIMGEVTQEGIPRHSPLGELGWAHYGDRYAALGVAYAYAGRPEAARVAFARGRDIFRMLGNYSTLGGIMTNEVLHLTVPYDSDKPDENWRLAHEATAAWGRSFTTSTRYGHLAHIPLLILEGRWTEAQREAEAALRVGMNPTWLDCLNPMLCELARGRGEPEMAWGHIHALLTSGWQTVPGRPALAVGLALLRFAAALCLDADDLSDAREWLEAHDRWLAASGAVLDQSDGRVLWARYYRQKGDAEHAYAHAQAALSHASEPRQPLALIAAHRLLGEVDTDATRHDDAAAHLAAALALADACHTPYERALTLLALADLRAATQDVIGARALVGEVRAICEPLGAKPILARADTLAASLAASSIAYPDNLSAREVEVLHLIAAGHNNHEIADALSISVRTVERHITNLYGKIGADGRADATAYALRHLR